MGHLPGGQRHQRANGHPGTGLILSKGVPVFNDHAGTYYDPSNPTGGVRVTDTNTKIAIVKEARKGSTILLKVGPALK